jgi:TetR/AcrR family acrAB operon transcriptional repressor
MYSDEGNGMRRTKEEAAITRQQLLKAALVVFSAKGYAATRLEDIAAEAGVTRGAIYWHFGNKAELYNTLLSEYGAGYAEVVTGAIADGGTALDILRRLLVRSLEFLVTDEQYRAMIEISLFKTELSGELSAGWALKLDSMYNGINSLAELMREGITAGVLRADLEPIEASRAFVAYLNGLSTLWLMDQMGQRTIRLKHSAPALAEIYLRGIATPDKS